MLLPPCAFTGHGPITYRGTAGAVGAALPLALVGVGAALVVVVVVAGVVVELDILLTFGWWPTPCGPCLYLPCKSQQWQAKNNNPKHIYFIEFERKHIVEFEFEFEGPASSSSSDRPTRSFPRSIGLGQFVKLGRSVIEDRKKMKILKNEEEIDEDSRSPKRGPSRIGRLGPRPLLVQVRGALTPSLGC